MFRDCDANSLTVGDPVTVLRSGRSALTARSHGTIEKFGTKLVHVRLTTARLESYDGEIHTFDPVELRKGHHGQPRHPQGPFGEMRESLEALQIRRINALINEAVARGVITQNQGTALESLACEVD